MPYVDILICGQGDARTVFGLEGLAEEVLAALHRLTPAEHIVLTQSHEGASTLLEGERVHVPAIEVEVLDRLGAGDAFAAGVLDGYLNGNIRSGLERGVALSALILAQHGDMLVTTPEEVEAVSKRTSKGLNR